MTFLFLDFETTSTIDLKRGAYLYAQKAEPVMLGYAIDNAPAQLIKFYEGETIKEHHPQVHKLLLDDDCTLIAFNCDFERLIFANCFLEYEIPYYRWFDVMLQSREAGLAGTLDEISAVFGSSKHAAGSYELKKLIRLKEYAQEANVKKRNAVLKNDLDEIKKIEFWLAKKIESVKPNMELIGTYCKQDVEETRNRMQQIPMMNYNSVKERRLAQITAESNDYGLPVDVNFVTRAAKAAELAKEKLGQVLHDLTDGAVSSGYHYTRMSKYLQKRFGVSAGQSTAAKEIELLRENANKYRDSAELIKLCDVWLTTGVAISKFQALLNSTHPFTHRCYGTLAFCGAARTKRWSGRLFQTQNLKRPNLKRDQVDDAIYLIETQPPEVVADIYTTDELGDCVRGCITAPENKMLIVADLASIEARAMRWLVNDEKALQLYEDVDNKRSTFDAYQMEYAEAFGVDDPSTVDDDQRFVGKVMQLSLQYMGGVPGLKKGLIQNGADIDEFIRIVLMNSSRAELMRAETEYDTFGHKITKDIVKSEYAPLAVARTRWRNANPRIVAFGKALERAFISAMHSPGYMFVAYNKEQMKERMVTFKYHANYDWMQCDLPLGQLWYPMPKLEYVKYNKDDTEEQGVRSITIRQASRKAPRTAYYAGKFLENVASGLSREIIGEGIIRSDDKNMPLLTMIHDEVVREALAYEAEEKLAELIEAMTAPIPELPDFPLAAKGFIAKRYRK